MNLNQFVNCCLESDALDPSPKELEKSYNDTKAHINKVIEYGDIFSAKLEHQIMNHDKSKLETPELELFAYYGPILSKLTYGSDEYKENLKKMGEALQHHYANNSHHPEHYKNGINDMNLFDIIEMLMDWKASGERTNDGSLEKSLEINIKRFHIDDQLASILKNTIELL